MKTITNITALLIVVVALIGCTRQTGRPDFGMNESIDRLFTDMFGEDEPGAAVMVMYHDTIVYEGFFGVADLGTKERISDSTMLNITSASKTFISVAIMRLVEEGRLSLTDTLSKFFPQFKSPVFKGITVEHILSHTSGLPDERPHTQEAWEKYRNSHSSTFGFGPDFRLYARGEELTRFFETIDTLSFVPGSRFEYQEAPYLLLPQIIENVTGKRFGSWMKTNVFDKAGVTEVVYFSPDATIPHLAHAYEPPQYNAKIDRVYSTSKAQWIEADYGEVEFFGSMADMGIYITPRDFMKWIKSVFNNEVVSKESLDKILAPRVATPTPDVSYCLGAFVTDNPYEPRKAFHSRRNGGFSAYTAFYPDQDLYYFIFANRGFWDRLKTSSAIDSIIFNNPRFPELNGLKPKSRI